MQPLKAGKGTTYVISPYYNMQNQRHGSNIHIITQALIHFIHSRWEDKLKNILSGQMF